MKKLFIFLLCFTMLFTMTACKDSKSPPKDDSSSGDSLTPDSGSSGDEQDDDDVSNDRVIFHDEGYYSRDEIISRNDSLVLFEDGIETIATDFILNKYAGCIVHTVDFASGFAIPHSLFKTEQYSGGADIYTVDYGAEGGEIKSERVQVIYYIKDNASIFLAGIVQDENIRDSRAAVSEYLRDDPRLADVTQDLPRVKYPAAGETTNLTRITGSSFSYISATFENGNYAIVSYDNSALYLLSGDKVLATYQPNDYYYTITPYSDRIHLNLADGVVELTQNGEISTLDIAPDSNVHKLNDNQEIFWDDHSIYLQEADTVITAVEGKGGDSLDSTSARFWKQLDAHRFVFVIYGYEWADSVGIYNTQTKKATYITAPDGAKHLNASPIALLSDNTMLCVDGPYSTNDFYIAQLDTMTSKQMPIPPSIANLGLEEFAVKDNSSKIALSFREDTDCLIKVVDLDSGAIIFDYAISLDACYFQSMEFAGDDLLILLCEYATDNDVLVRVPLK